MSYKVDLINNQRRKEEKFRMIHPQTKSSRLTWPAEDIYEQVMAIAEKNAASKMECFKFAKGNCRDKQCRWSHDSSNKKL